MTLRTALVLRSGRHGLDLDRGQPRSAVGEAGDQLRREARPLPVEILQQDLPRTGFTESEECRLERGFSDAGWRLPEHHGGAGRRRLASQRPAGREVRRADAGDDPEPAGRRLGDHGEHPSALLGAKRADLARNRGHQHTAAAGVGAMIDQSDQTRLVDRIVRGERRMQARDDAAKVGSGVEVGHAQGPCRCPRRAGASHHAPTPGLR